MMNEELMQRSDIWAGWKIVREIGRGASGAVYEIQKEEAGHAYRAALKEIYLENSEAAQRKISRFRKEALLLSDLRGDSHVVSYVDHAVIPDGESGVYILIQMELLQPFNDWFSSCRIDDGTVKKVGLDLCEALTRCQKRNIIHRDIKPQNIFVSKFGDFKLGDFGVAAVTDDEHFRGSLAGTRPYMAPESYREWIYNYSTDVYSLGMVLYYMLNDGRLPFIESDVPDDAEKEFALSRRIRGDKIPDPAHGSPALKAAVMKALSFQPENRYQSAGEFREALEKSGTASFEREQTADGRETVPYKRQIEESGHGKDIRGKDIRGRDVREKDIRGRDIGGKILAAGACSVIIIAAAFFAGSRLVKNRTGAQQVPADPVQSESVSMDIEAESGSVTDTVESAVSNESVQSEAHDRITSPEEADVGDVIVFGSYEQDNDTSDGKEAIEWVVLEKSDDSLLVISRYALDGRVYDESYLGGITWDTCSLRRWLNNDFFSEAFSQSEQMRIEERMVAAAVTPGSETSYSSSRETMDRVFILSTEEAQQYLTEELKKCEATAYAAEQDVYISKFTGYCRWWTRTSVSGRNDAAFVDSEGSLDSGYSSTYSSNAVRPAMRIRTAE